MDTCVFCKKNKPLKYCLTRIVLRTNKQTQEFGIRALTDGMYPWLFKNACHLSATEVILLRPDLLIAYFSYLKPKEKVLNWYFKEYYTCKECYEEYKESVPVI